MLYDVTEDLNIGRTAEPSQGGYNSKWMQEFGFFAALKTYAWYLSALGFWNIEFE